MVELEQYQTVASIKLALNSNQLFLCIIAPVVKRSFIPNAAMNSCVLI